MCSLLYMFCFVWESNTLSHNFVLIFRISFWWDGNVNYFMLRVSFGVRDGFMSLFDDRQVRGNAETQKSVESTAAVRWGRRRKSVRREAGTEKRGECQGESQNEDTQQSIFQTEDNTTVGAAGHEAVQAGHPPAGDQLHRPSADHSDGRRKSGSRRPPAESGKCRESIARAKQSPKIEFVDASRELVLY